MLFLPYMRGVFAGGYNPNPCGAFLGLSLRHEQAHLIRAVIEGIGLALRELVSLFLAQGLEVREIRVIGGGARSAVWRQTIADICGVRIARPRHLQEAGRPWGRPRLAASGWAGCGISRKSRRITRFRKPTNRMSPCVGGTTRCSTFSRRPVG